MKKLFNDFDPISSKQWKQRIQFELDGADYAKSLIWNSPEDIQVKPFYHRDEFKGSFSSNTKATAFKICQNIFVHKIKKSNRQNLGRVLYQFSNNLDSIYKKATAGPPQQTKHLFHLLTCQGYPAHCTPMGYFFLPLSSNPTRFYVRRW